MKFFIISLFLLLLFDSPQGSSLPHRRSVRALNTTLQTNFNGTYERRNPCTNAEIETSSYVASHEFHHHTKEDTWSDYSHKCSAIISGFLQAIGNLVRFNNKQNGIFNFHINTSISQKQDGHCDPDQQKSCSSLPTIIIEATDGEISPRSPVENQPLQTEPPCEENAMERKYSVTGQSENEEGKIGDLVTSTPSQENKNFFYSKDYPTTPQRQTTTSFKDTTPVYPQQVVQNGDNLSTPDDFLLTAKQTSKNVPPFVSQFPGKGIATPYQTSPAVFNDIPLNVPTTYEPEKKLDFYGTSPTPIFKPDVPNAITFRPEDDSTMTSRFPTAYEPSPPNTLENPSAVTAVTYPEKFEPLNSISSSPMPFRGFNEGTDFNTPRSTPSQSLYSTEDFTQQLNKGNTEEQLTQNQYQPSLVDEQQPQTVDSRQPLYDNLGGRVPESQQSANSFTPANEIPTTGLTLNQADSFIPFRHPTALDRPLSYPQILPSSVESGVSQEPEFQGVSNFDNGNKYSSQPLPNTRAPIPFEFPQTVIPGDVNTFSLPSQSPNAREIENINTTPFPQSQNNGALPDPFANNNSPDPNDQILANTNIQNQAVTSMSFRPEYDEPSTQMSVMKPKQPNDDFLINTRPTLPYDESTSTPQFPINYSVSPLSPTITTDYDTNESTTRIPSELPTESPLFDQKTPRTDDATLAPELGFTDVPSPFNIKTQPTEPGIFYNNHPTTLTPNQQFPIEENSSNQNYNEFSPIVTTQRPSFFTSEPQLNQTPFNTEQNLAKNNEQILGIPPKTNLPYPGPAFNDNNMPPSSTFQTITTPKIQAPQSLITFNQSPEQQPTENYKISQPPTSVESGVSTPFQSPVVPNLQSLDYPGGRSTQMPDSTVFNQHPQNTFIPPEPQTNIAPFGEIPTTLPPETPYTAGPTYGSEGMTPVGSQSQHSPDYTGLPDSNIYSKQHPNTFIQPESQLSSIAPFNQFPPTSPEQQPIQKYEIPKPPASVEPGVSTPFQSPGGPNLQSVDYPSDGSTQMSDPTVSNQQPPSTFIQPKPQLTSNAPFGEIPTPLPPESQYTTGPTYGGEAMTPTGPESQPSSGFPDSAVNNQQMQYAGFQPEPQLSSQFPTTLSPELQPIGDYEIPPPPTSGPAYEDEIMTTQLPTPEFHPSIDYANQYANDEKTGKPSSTDINQQTSNSFLNPELQFLGNAPPNQFSGKEIQSYDVTPFIKGSSRTEHLTSPVSDSASEAFVPTLANTDSQPVTNSATPYSNQNLDYSTQTPFTDSIPTTPYNNQPELRPDLIAHAQPSPDNLPTTLAPDYTDQTYTTLSPFEPSAPIGYEGENNFSGLPLSTPSTSYSSQQPYFPPGKEFQTTSSSRPTVIPQASFSFSQNPDGTLVQPSLSVSGDPRMSGQYSDIHSPTAPSQNRTIQPDQFLDERDKITQVPRVPDQPFDSFTTPGSYPGTGPAYTWTSSNSFVPESSPNGDSLIYNQMEQRASTIGPYTVDDFSRGNQTAFSSQPFLQDVHDKFPSEQPLLNPEFSISNSARNRYETPYPEQTSDPRGQISYGTFPTTPIPNQEPSTSINSMLNPAQPLTTQMQPEESFASSNQLSNYGTTLPASDPTVLENSGTAPATPFVGLNEGQPEQSPEQSTEFTEYPNGGFTSGPHPTFYEPTTYRESLPTTITPINDQQPFYTPQAEPVTPALLPEEIPSSTATYMPQSEPQENIPTEQINNFGQTGQMPDATRPVQQPSTVYPMNYQPDSDLQPRITYQPPSASEFQTPEQLSYAVSETTDLPSEHQPNQYKKDITFTEYQPTVAPLEGPHYPNEMSNFNSSPENSVTFPPVGPQSRIPQFTPKDLLADSFAAGQPKESPKMQTDPYVSYSQTGSASELESQSMISTSGNDQPSYVPEPQTGTTLPYSNDNSGGFKPAFAGSEQTPLDVPLRAAPPVLTENQTTRQNEFQNLDSTSTQPQNYYPFYGTSNPSTENTASVPTTPPRFQFNSNQQQPASDGLLSTPSNLGYNQFSSTASSEFTSTKNEEPIAATDYPSFLPKATILSNTSPDYYTDVPTFGRNSENEQSLNGFDPKQGIEPQPNGVFTGSPNYTHETSAPTEEYQGRAPGTGPAPQDSQQNLKSQFLQESTPMYSTPPAREPQQPFDYVTEIPDYRTTVGPDQTSNTFDNSSPFHLEAFDKSGSPSATTLQPGYKNAPDTMNTRPGFSLPGTQPQNSGQEYDPNFKAPTPTLGSPQTDNRPDLAFSNPVELTTDGITSLPYQTANPTTASYQTISTPATPPAGAQINLNNEPNIALGELNAPPAQKASEIYDTIPPQFQPSTALKNYEGTTLPPEFRQTPPMNYEQFSPSISEIPDRSIQYEPMSDSQSTPVLRTQQPGPVDPHTQYTTSPRQQTDYPPPLASQPQDQIPHGSSFNQQNTQSNDQLLQQKVASDPVFYGQFSTAPPESLNGKSVTTSEYPASESQAPVLNYNSQISDPEWQPSQIDQTQPNIKGNNPIINNDQPSTLFTEQPTFERSGEIVPATPQIAEPQSVDYTKRSGDYFPGTGSDKPVFNEYDKPQPEIFLNPQKNFNGYQPTPEQNGYPGPNLNGNIRGTQSYSSVNFPPSFQQTTPSGILSQTPQTLQTPTLKTLSDSNRRLTSGPLTSPETQPPSFAPEQQTIESPPFASFPTNGPLNPESGSAQNPASDFPVSGSPADTQFSYPDKLLNNGNNRLEVSRQDVTDPQPYGTAESSSYPDPLNRYNVRKRPDRQLAFGGTTIPQYLENENDKEGPLPVNTSQNPESDQQRTVPGNPVSPSYADYDQGLSTQSSKFTEYGGTTLGFAPRNPTLTDRQFITEGPYDPRLGTTAQRETDSPLGFGFEERSPHPPSNNGLSRYPPRQQHQHSNPLLKTLESQIPFPMHGYPQQTAASSFPEKVSLDPRSSPIPFSFEPQNQNDVSTIPSYYPGGGFERNFVTSQPSQSNARGNTAQDVMNTPLPDSHALVSDLTPTPSNKPGEDYVSCCRNGSSPLLCPFDPVLKGNMTAPSYYILISKLPVVDDKDEHFQVEKVYLGDGTPLNCTLSAGKTFPTSLYTPIQIKAARAVTLPTKSDFA